MDTPRGQASEQHNKCRQNSLKVLERDMALDETQTGSVRPHGWLYRLALPPKLHSPIIFFSLCSKPIARIHLQVPSALRSLCHKIYIFSLRTKADGQLLATLEVRQCRDLHSEASGYHRPLSSSQEMILTPPFGGPWRWVTRSASMHSCLEVCINHSNKIPMVSSKQLKAI